MLDYMNSYVWTFPGPGIYSQKFYMRKRRKVIFSLKYFQLVHLQL